MGKTLQQPGQKTQPELTPYQLLVTGNYSVLPSGGGDLHKSPLVKWQRYQNETPTLEDLGSWEQEHRPSLWGVVTGAISGVVVIDVDKPELRKIFDEVGLKPHIQTPRGGFHYWFSHPGYQVITKAGILPDIDIRADGGFINVIGHRKDGSYKVLIPPLPDKLYSWDQLPDQIAKAIKKTKGKALTIKGGIIPDHERNATLISIAGSLRRKGLPPGGIEAALQAINTENCKPPLEASEVTTIAQSAGKYQPPETKDLPQVIITGVHTRDITAKALEALHDQNNPAHLFRRSDRLIRVSVDESGKPYTEELHSASFKGCIDRACNFVRVAVKSEELIPTPAPKDVVEDGLTRPDLWKFPPLLGITEVPVLRPDGTVLSKLGYDEVTRLYYSPAHELEIPTIPENPTDAQVKDAAKLIVEPVCDFPFDSQSSWANAIGTMFAPILRPMITTPVPMALFDKPQQGTGATLLADVVSIIATGRSAAIQSPPESNDAWRKAITSILWKGQLVATLDNIEGELESSALAAALTSTIWQDRLLGQTETLQIINRLMWIGTGNNVKLKGDLPRRCIWCRMDAHTPRPWMRDVKFKHPDLTKWVTENRGAILAAMLTVARAWSIAGMPVPDDLPILGGYDSYCRVVGGVRPLMGVKGFVGNLDRMYDETDTSTPQWACFFGQWHDLLAEDTYTSAELVSWILDDGDFKESLPDELADIFAGLSKNHSVMLGQRLRHKIEVQYDNGYVLCRAGTKKHAVTWQVKKVTSPTTSPKFSLEGEVSEVATTLAQGKNKEPELLDDNNIIGGKVAETSPTSPLATKGGEVGAKTGPDANFACLNCKGREYWIEHGKVKRCAKCWTPPEGVRTFEDD